MPQQYYIRVRGAVQGPFDVERLKTLATRGKFSRSHEVSTDRVTWTRASNHPELFPPPPAAKVAKKPPPEPPRRVSPETKSGKAASGESIKQSISQSIPDQPISAKTVSAQSEDQPLEPEFLLDGTYDLVEDDGPAADTAETEWFYAQDSVERGPLSFATLQQLASTGAVQAETPIWTSAKPNRVAANSVSGLFGTADRHGAAPDAQRESPPGDVSLEFQQVVPMSIASLILALLGVNAIYVLPLSLAKRAYALVGVSVLLVLTSVLAVVCGHLALRQIKHSAGTLAGGGMALGGLILGYFVIVAVTVVGIVVGFIVLLGGSIVLFDGSPPA